MHTRAICTNLLTQSSQSVRLEKSPAKEYKLKNKLRIEENYKELLDCDCGAVITRWGLSQHNKSKKHKFYLKTLE